MSTPKRSKIWVIDDNEFILNLVEKGVNHYMPLVDIEKFSSFNEALRTLRLNEVATLPDLILLDYDFGPEGTATDFLKEADAMQSDFTFKILLYTNNHSFEVLEKLLIHPLVYGFVHKPIKLEDLIQILNKELL
jgi:DNA-binding NtrC family response regulator